MNEGRHFASLSSGLLARKGAAKPAMRPQSFPIAGAGLEDLGWNDMGYGAPAFEPAGEPPFAEERVPSSIAALTPVSKADAEIENGDVAREDESPLVERQQREIAERFQAEAEVEPEAEVETDAEAEIEQGGSPLRTVKRKRAERAADIVSLPSGPKPARAEEARRKAAFTLRLDGERHYRLRLATAVTGRSAQQIVTAALDSWLDAQPEIEALAERVPVKRASRN